LSARLALTVSSCLTFGLSCFARKTPDHLKVQAPDLSAAAAAPPMDLAEAITQLTKGDPLVRRPNARSEEWWLSAAGGAPITAWRSVVGHAAVDAAVLVNFEGAWRGTPAVALSRGACLAELERELLTEGISLEGDRALLTWLGSVVVQGPAGPNDVRPALTWLDPSQGRAALLRVAERHVMLGWLDGPEIPLAPVEAAMTVGTFDRLRDLPAGRVMVARAEATEAADPAKLDEGRTLFSEATHLMLLRASADNAPQQEQAQRIAEDLHQRHQLSGDDTEDPLPQLLHASLDALVEAGGGEDSTGLALVVVTAERLVDACPDRPCAGLDLHDTLSRASAWSAEAESFAWAWRLATAKDLRDQLEVSNELGLSTDALPAVADLIVGEHTARVPVALMQQNTLTPAAVLAVTRGLHQPDGTQPADALRALDVHMVRLCETLPSSLPSTWQPSVDRICAGATQALQGKPAGE